MEFNDIPTDSKLEMSVKDSRALGIMEGSEQLKEGHYEIAFLWGNFPASLPNNKPLTEHRLNHLKKRLMKDFKLFVKYAASMDDLMMKGYARKVPQSSLSQPQQPLRYGFVFQDALNRSH